MTSTCQRIVLASRPNGWVTTDNVRLELRDADSQGILTPVGDETNEYRYVVMPMRF